MQKNFILITIAFALILSSPLSQLLNEAHAQALTANINQKSYTPRDTLVVFGKTFPNDSLISELFNPKGRLVQRTQIDAGVEGSFSRILLEWPNPNDNFPFGVYTLSLKSSINRELSTNLVFRFSDVPAGTAGPERMLAVQVSVPPAMGKNEVTMIIVEVLVNGVLVKGNAEETLENSRVYYPDGSIVPIDNFKAIDDGIYVAEFSSSMVGHHIIHIQAFYQGLIANNAQGVFVEEGTVLSLGKEIGRVNENLEKLREETAVAIENMSAASGQIASLLLPIVGMIAVIIALQATILSRRGKPNNQ